MLEAIFFLAVVAVALCFWILSLLSRLRSAEDFAGMTMMALRDVADGKVTIKRTAEGEVTIVRCIPKTDMSTR